MFGDVIYLFTMEVQSESPSLNVSGDMVPFRSVQLWCQLQLRACPGGAWAEPWRVMFYISPGHNLASAWSVSVVCSVVSLRIVN